MKHERGRRGHAVSPYRPAGGAPASPDCGLGARQALGRCWPDADVDSSLTVSLWCSSGRTARRCCSTWTQCSRGGSGGGCGGRWRGWGGSARDGVRHHRPGGRPASCGPPCADGATVIRLRSVSGRPFDSSLTGLCLWVEMDTGLRRRLGRPVRRGAPRTRPGRPEPAQAAALGMALVRRPTGSRTLTWPGRRTPVCWDALEAPHGPAEGGAVRGFLQDGPSPWNSSGCGTPTGGGGGLPAGVGAHPPAHPGSPGLRGGQRAGRFTVTGPDGSACSFDLIRGGPAEKLFLKILFPLDKRE